MKSFKLFNNICGWIAFAIATVVYLMTVEPTASFWDCGEFIATADKLEVGHPPGAPFFMLVGRLFTLMAADQSQVALMMNSFSAICSSLCIMFLFWTITNLARKILVGHSFDLNLGQTIGVLGAGFVGAMACTFSDTFWFSAVEAEVYAFSSLFTAVVFWAMLKWDDVADEPHANRWIVFIAYLMGISVAVHLLNLLTIPALCLIYYFRKYKTTLKGSIITLLISVGVLAAILYGIVPGFVEVASWFELLFVNVLGFSFNTGTLCYAILLISSLVWSIYETSDKNGNPILQKLSFLLSVSLLGIPFFGGKVFLGIVLILVLAVWLFSIERRETMIHLNTIVLCLTVILIGYSSYAVVVIRSSANPPMDQNSPDDVFTLKSYLNRDQYGDTPLLFGKSYASDLERKRNGDYNIEEKEAIWAKKIKVSDEEKDSYEAYDHKKKYHYDYEMFFPRMHSDNPNHVSAYKSWANIEGKTFSYRDRSGNLARKNVPTFSENLKFFFKYQVGFMYWRYFMWNFVGRQNDIQGHGEITNGNWISGISFIDNMLVGDQTNLPDELKNNKGRNTYYFLPFILGILGILFQFNRGKKGMESFWLTLILFFMTGLAIVLYLNQTPYQPRERDYAYAGSFYAYCIWIGFGVLFVMDFLYKFLKNNKIAAAIATLLCIPVPALMAAQNWDDHDRSNRYTARDYGQNYLLSLAPNAIIFTNGDNDTFPLWYNQEVEGCRTDVRVANLSYLQMDWYVEQMQKQTYESDPLPMSLLPIDYSNGKKDVVYVSDKLESLDLGLAMKLFTTEKQKMGELKARLGLRPEYDILLSDRLTLDIDSAAAVNSGTVRPELAKNIVKRIEIDLKNKSYIGKHELVILDLLANNNWERPIYFAVSGGEELGLRRYFQLEGMANRLVPVNFRGNDGGVNTEVMYDNMMHKFKWGGLDKGNTDIYMDENNIRMATTHRFMFVRLAEGLINEGKNEKAEEVLDYCQKVIPSALVPHDVRSVYIANLYEALGKKEKAHAITSELSEKSLQYLKWYYEMVDKRASRLSPSEKSSENLARSLGITSDYKQYLSLLNFLSDIERRLGNTEIADDLDKEVELYAGFANKYNF